MPYAGLMFAQEWHHHWDAFFANLDPDRVEHWIKELEKDFEVRKHSYPKRYLM